MDQVARPDKVIKSVTWLRVTTAAATVLLASAAVYWIGRQGLRRETITLALFAVLVALAAIEAAVSQIVLTHDALLVRSLRGTRSYARSDIALVKWESGSGAGIQMNDGTWVKLPDLGRNAQGMTNSIRAWLKRDPDA